MLKNCVENERHQVNKLNHQIFLLNQKLYEAGLSPQPIYYMSDSLDSMDFGKQLHIKIDPTIVSSIPGHATTYQKQQEYQQLQQKPQQPIRSVPTNLNIDSGVSVHSQSDIGFSPVEDFPLKVGLVILVILFIIRSWGFKVL